VIAGFSWGFYSDCCCGAHDPACSMLARGASKGSGYYITKVSWLYIHIQVVRCSDCASDVHFCSLWAGMDAKLGITRMPAMNSYAGFVASEG
jgi:hypothetical protein